MIQEDVAPPPHTCRRRNKIKNMSYPCITSCTACPVKGRPKWQTKPKTWNWFFKLNDNTPAAMNPLFANIIKVHGVFFAFEPPDSHSQMYNCWIRYKHTHTHTGHGRVLGQLLAVTGRSRRRKEIERNVVSRETKYRNEENAFCLSQRKNVFVFRGRGDDGEVWISN